MNGIGYSTISLLSGIAWTCDRCGAAITTRRQQLHDEWHRTLQPLIDKAANKRARESA